MYILYNSPSTVKYADTPTKSLSIQIKVPATDSLADITVRSQCPVATLLVVEYRAGYCDTQFRTISCGVAVDGLNCQPTAVLPKLELHGIVVELPTLTAVPRLLDGIVVVAATPEGYNQHTIVETNDYHICYTNRGVVPLIARLGIMHAKFHLIVPQCHSPK